MFKRMIAAVVALGLVFSVPGLGYAAFTVRDGGSIPVAATVPDSVGFGINVNGDGTLNYAPTLTAPVAIADDSVQVVFKNNLIYGAETFKSIIISTDNRLVTAVPKYTGTGTGSGLVNAGATTIAAPLHWTAWRTEAEANVYDKTDTPTSWPAFNFAATPDPKIRAGRTENEALDSRTHFFVSDKKQDQATDFVAAPFSPGFATVVAGITGTTGGLANAPVDSTPGVTTDDYEDFAPLGTVGSEDNFNAGPQRSVEQDLDGAGQVDVWLRLACNFTGQPAGSYSTSTLKIELISQTP